jgi:hypothetical protein
MNFSGDYQDLEQARRFRHRSILFFIILATLPCYIVGAIMLGVAPKDESDTVASLPPPNQSTRLATGSITLITTITGTATGTRQPTSTIASIGSTPGQFRTPTRFPTSTATATITPTSTPTTTATATVTSTVAATSQPNQNPIFNPPPQDQTLLVGETKTVNLSFSDPDGDTVSFTAVSSNPGIVSIPQFGATSFNITGMAQGTATVTVTLTDSRGGTTNATINITVNPAATNQNPIFNVEPLDIVVNQGANSTVTLVFSDPDGDTVTFTAVSAAPGIASVTPLDSTSFRVDGVSAGATTITITLSDGRGGTTQRTINVTVNPGAPNSNPTFAQEPLPISIKQGDSDVVILFIGDPDGDAITLTVVSANIAIVTAIKLDNQSFTIQGVAVGSTTINITLTDGRGGMAQRTVTATVTPP